MQGTQRPASLFHYWRIQGTQRPASLFHYWRIQGTQRPASLFHYWRIQGTQRESLELRTTTKPKWRHSQGDKEATMSSFFFPFFLVFQGRPIFSIYEVIAINTPSHTNKLKVLPHVRARIRWGGDMSFVLAELIPKLSTAPLDHPDTTDTHYLLHNT